MAERRIPVNVEIMPPASPGSSHANASVKADFPVRKLTMAFKSDDTFGEMLEQIKTRYSKSCSVEETEEEYFTSLQSLSNGDLLLEDKIGWHFHEDIRMEERVVRMRRTRKDEQNSPQSDSPSQSRSEKRRHGEDSALEQQNEPSKRRRTAKGGHAAAPIAIDDDTARTSPENASPRARVSKERAIRSARMLANDREGFALPSLPASQTRNAQASANAQSTLLVPNTQPGAQNTQPAGRLIRPKKVLRTPPTSDQAPAVSMQTTSTSVNPAPTTNKTPFQIALSTRNPFSKMMSSQNAQSSQPSATSSKSRRWTPQEDEAIIRGKRAKLTAPAIIKQYKLDRNDSAVRNRLRELGIKEQKVQQQLNSQLQVTSAISFSSQTSTQALTSGSSSQAQQCSTPVQTEPLQSTTRPASDTGAHNSPSRSDTARSVSQTRARTQQSSSPNQGETFEFDSQKQGNQQHQSSPVHTSLSPSGFEARGNAQPSTPPQAELPVDERVKMHIPTVKFDWPSPEYGKRPRVGNGMINVGTQESPRYMAANHPWVKSDNELWTEAVALAKEQWVYCMYNHLKAANVHLIYMSTPGLNEACKKMNRSRRLARAEVRQMMGLCKLQDKARQSYRFQRITGQDRGSPDVADSQFSLELDDDDQDDIALMYKNAEMAVDDELRGLMDRSEDDEDPYPDGLIYDRHVSEVPDDDEEKMDDYDRERRILDIPAFLHQQSVPNVEEIEDDELGPALQRARCSKAIPEVDAIDTQDSSQSGPIEIFDDARNFVGTRVDSVMQGPGLSDEIDVYDGAKNCVGTKGRGLRSASPAVEPKRPIMTRSGYEVVVDSIKDGYDGPTDTQALRDFAANGEFDSCGEEDEDDVKCDKKEVKPTENKPTHFAGLDGADETGIKAYFAPVQKKGSEPSGQNEAQLGGLDGTDESGLTADAAPVKKQKRKHEPGFGYVERTEEQLQAARAAEPSPRRITTIIQVPNNESDNAVDGCHELVVQQDGNLQGRRGSRRKKNRQRKSKEQVEAQTEETTEPENPSSRTTVSIKGSPQQKGTRTTPTSTKVAAKQKRSFVKTASAQRSAWLSSPPPQPNFKQTAPKRAATPFPHPRPINSFLNRYDPAKDPLVLRLAAIPRPASRPKTPPLKLPYPSDDDSYDWSTDDERAER